MAAEQQHGKSFERLIIDASGFYPRAEGVRIDHLEPMDIPARLTEDGMPVSIKAAKCDPLAGTQPVLGLSDARRFYRNLLAGPMRLTAGIYHKSGPDISFYAIHEFELDPSLRTQLWGDITLADVEAFTQLISDWGNQDTAEGNRSRTRAQKRARLHKGPLMLRGGTIDLNPKISSSNQRLQCSIKLPYLRSACLERGLRARLFAGRAKTPGQYGNICLPLVMRAGARTRRAGA